MLQNRKIISQATWRVYLVHLIAKALGVLAHVEGIPIGSNRIHPGRRDWQQASAQGMKGGIEGRQAKAIGMINGRKIAAD